MRLQVFKGKITLFKIDSFAEEMDAYIVLKGRVQLKELQNYPTMSSI